MPRGTQHTLIGTLRRRRLGYVLEMDGGGVWRLDIDHSAKHLLDRRIVIEGVRSGFDLIDVARAWRAGTPRPFSIVERLIAFARL